MYRELADVVHAHVGLLLRLEKSKLAFFGPSPELMIPSEDLAAIERASGDDGLRLLGYHVQVDGGFRSELRVQPASA